MGGGWDRSDFSLCSEFTVRRTVPCIQGSTLQSGLLPKSDNSDERPVSPNMCYALVYAGVTNVTMSNFARNPDCNMEPRMYGTAFSIVSLVGLETERVLDFQGRAGIAFHCAVEPSSSHTLRIF